MKLSIDFGMCFHANVMHCSFNFEIFKKQSILHGLKTKVVFYKWNFGTHFKVEAGWFAVCGWGILSLLLSTIPSLSIT